MSVKLKALFACIFFVWLVLLLIESTGRVNASPLENHSKPSIPNCDPDWQVVPAPVLGQEDALEAVDAVSANNVWAVGAFRESGVARTFTARWDGTTWSHVPSPNMSAGAHYLSGVAAVTSPQLYAWASGSYFTGALERTLIAFWDGAGWTLNISDNAGPGNNHLNAIDATTLFNAWSVGHYDNNGTDQTLTMHFQSGVFAVEPSPNVGTGDNHLNAVKVLSDNNAWAVGEYSSGTANRTLIEHWDGSAWHIVPSPNEGTGDNTLQAVTAVSSTDAWAFGAYFDANNTYRTLILHWDGASWSIVPGANVGTNTNFLRASTAISANDIWAAGYYFAEGYHTLILHWDGASWSHVPSPNAGVGPNNLTGISAVSASDVWAVGNFVDTSAGRSLIERYNPCVGSPTPTGTALNTGTPTRTSTPTRTRTPSGTPTRTRTVTHTPTNTPIVFLTNTWTPFPFPTGIFTPLPTNTPLPTATSTLCPIQFADVLAGSPFYSYIRCLACLGIASGYPCGGLYEPCDPGNHPYFRASANMTRAQAAKIVSNSAGFVEPPGAQVFDDVPPTHPFFDFIQRMANRNIINGYVCGGPGEPCGPENRPYFRPYNSLLRGQFAKMVANAAGFFDPPGAIDFQDIPSFHPFFFFIQQLSNRSILSGYPCGGPGEPCGPFNLPYFRPYVDVTRGQAAKITSATFFPACDFPLGQLRSRGKK